jgi:superoxide dismutase, Cu-Zn family
MRRSIQLLGGAVGMMTVVTGVALAQQLTVDVNKISDAGVGEKIGTITVTESKKGTNFKVAVNGIPSGKHGFHVHQEGNCAAGTKDGKTEPGLAAGGHYDPDGKKSHKGPQAPGHKGDLPVLTATAKGVKQTVTAPKLKLSDVQGARW